MEVYLVIFAERVGEEERRIRLSDPSVRFGKTHCLMIVCGGVDESLARVTFVKRLLLAGLGMIG